MNPKSFEYLELIPELLEHIKNLEKRLDRFTPQLDNKKAVVTYLGISNTTYYQYFKDGRFKLGLHYYKEHGKIFFVEDEIIKLKK